MTTQFHTHSGSNRQLFVAADGFCRLCRPVEEEIAAAMSNLHFEPILTSSTGGDVSNVGDMAVSEPDVDAAAAKRAAFYAKLGVDVEALRKRFGGNEKRLARWLRTEAIRQSRTIVLNWTGLDGEKGRAVIGINNDANRARAAQLQQAANKKGFKASFRLVRV